MKLILATHNSHKVEELKKILAGQLDGIDLLPYDGPEPIEDGETFSENALIKARAAFSHSGVPTISDDSGICVEALGGAPGIHSARFAGTRVDADNVAKLLEVMKHQANRRAEFHCAAAFVTDGFEHVEVGVWPGSVLFEAQGTNGFGYDPVFEPEGYDIASAQLSSAQKNAISHRRRAFSQLMPIVRNRLLGQE
ncbi:MAG: RdgB/HAM1 family non-canonical purine NTP pyrophosphatase [Cryobacterium sp.]|nr:RdgB/HAM1 family non-canonical purine NTP pyrophosphatase [Cryobacterium sp.]